ncbi:MAG TPA: hypothetical protein VJI75_03295 [Candidatus Nanoarchaeia archaeon]|nr:hypothetical protein [Candidatus Nanoarchaeia archaeon]
MFSKLPKRYRKILSFNKELLISEIGAFVGGPGFAQLSSLFLESKALIAFSASAGDYLGYTAFYALSSFFDNKEAYWNPRKKRVNRIFFKHILKFIIGASVVDVIYYSARTYATYFILGMGITPYLAAFISQSVTLVLYLGLMNIMGHVTGIIQKKDISKG